MPTDRRVLKTRRALRDALVALLHEQPWEDISVQDVCARADVGRSTFYLHFADKEELLVGGFEDLGSAIRAQVGPARPARDSLPSAGLLIEHALENRRLFHALVGRRTGQVVVRRFRELVRVLLDEDLAALGAPAHTRDLAARFLAGGLVEVLTTALDGPAVPDGRALDQRFQGFAASAIALARSTPR